MLTAFTCKRCGQNYGVSRIFQLCVSADPSSGVLDLRCPICESYWNLTIENEWVIAGGREELPDPVIVEHQRIYLPGIGTQRDSSGITVTVSGGSYFIPYRQQGQTKL